MISTTTFFIFEVGTCLNCGSFRNTGTGLCDYCCQKILWPRLSLGTKQTRDGLTVRSLFDWTPGESDEFSKWILRLKKSPSCKWSRLADLFVQHHISDLGRGGPCLLIPCPNAEKSRDHALKWARAIGVYGHGPLIEALDIEKKARSGPQKIKNRQERRNIEFVLSEKITGQMHLERFEKIIFLDDIVTSGSTARAAHKALGSPKNFEVWCVGHRLSLRHD